MALALAQVAAPLRQGRVLTLRQTMDEWVGVGQSDRRDDLVIGGVEPAIADVVHN